MFKAIGLFVIAVFVFMMFSANSFANDKSNSYGSHYNSQNNSHGSGHNSHLGQNHYSGNKGHGYHAQKHHVKYNSHNYHHYRPHHYIPSYTGKHLNYPYSGISNLFYGGYNTYDPHGSLHLGFVLR